MKNYVNYEGIQASLNKVSDDPRENVHLEIMAGQLAARRLSLPETKKTGEVFFVVSPSDLPQSMDNCEVAIDQLAQNKRTSLLSEVAQSLHKPTGIAAARTTIVPISPEDLPDRLKGEDMVVSAVVTFKPRSF